MRFKCKITHYKITNCSFCYPSSSWLTPPPTLIAFCTLLPIPLAGEFCLALKGKRWLRSIGKDATSGLCAADIEQRVKLAQPTVSHHMRILAKAGLVEAKRQGHWRWYRRNEKLIVEMTRVLKGQL